MCLRHWGVRNVYSAHKEGPCTGPFTWEPPNQTSDHWKLKLGRKAFVKGQAIHPTHALCWYRGMYYCGRCGRYTIQRVDRLSELCPLKPTGKSTAGRLKRIINSTHPCKDGTWPLEHDAMPPL